MRPVVDHLRHVAEAELTSLALYTRDSTIEFVEHVTTNLTHIIAMSLVEKSPNLADEEDTLP